MVHQLEVSQLHCLKTMLRIEFCHKKARSHHFVTNLGRACMGAVFGGKIVDNGIRVWLHKKAGSPEK